MKNDLSKQSGLSRVSVFIKGFIIEVLAAAVLITAFAFIIYITENGYKYAALFATVSVAAGAFLASFYMAKKINTNGWLIGLAAGAATFLVITAVSLIISHGSFTYNTLFHFVIIVLASLIGGILGVNKNTRKYI